MARGTTAPLAVRMRPTSLDEVVGQRHLLGPGSPLRRLAAPGAGASGQSVILWGPPGTGKTTLAQSIAHTSDRRFVELSAVTAGVKDVRQVMEDSLNQRDLFGQSTVLFDAQRDYYDDKTCHRLTTSEGFSVLQCGSVDGQGSGDPAFMYGPIENAPADDVYTEGTIAMARQGGNADSNGHQFFIVYGDTTIPSDAAGGYTVIGQVTSGLDQLKESVISLGTEGGVPDGPPAEPVVIEDFVLQ